MKLVIVSLEAGSGQINHYSTLGQIAGLEEGLNGGYGPTQLPAIHLDNLHREQGASSNG